MEEKLTTNEWHRSQAIDNFNATWDLMNKTDRTEDEDFKMIHTAHASRFHWGEIGTSLEFSRGEWQLARVYAVLKRFESSIFHGEYCLKLCLENKIGDFDLAFAYEAIARAYMVKGNKELMDKNIQLALEAGNDIADPEDKEYFLAELENIKL